MERNVYLVNIKVNKRNISRVLIDPHYQLKHSLTVTDQLILKLVFMLDGCDHQPEVCKNKFEYYVTDNIKLAGKSYKLIWLMEENTEVIGVINAYRRN